VLTVQLDERAAVNHEQVFVCLYSVTVVLATERYGWKLHIYDIPPHEIENSLKAGMAAKVFWIIAASLTRMSLLCFYKRVASNTSVYWFNRALITAQFLVVAFGVITTTLVIFLCRFVIQSTVNCSWMLTSTSAAQSAPSGPSRLSLLLQHNA